MVTSIRHFWRQCDCHCSHQLPHAVSVQVWESTGQGEIHQGNVILNIPQHQTCDNGINKKILHVLQSFHTPLHIKSDGRTQKKVCTKSLLIKYSAVGINLFVGWQLSVLFSDRNVIDRQRFHCFKFANSEGILKGVIHKGRSQEYRRTRRTYSSKFNPGHD